ncbi:MAG: NlpC/P60 family protein [Ilumatobacteraceae bacterium]
MRSGSRLHVLATVVVVGLLSAAAAVPGAYAGSVDQERQRVQQIADQLEDLENRIGELDEQHAAALDRVEQLTDEIAVSQAKVDAQQAQLNQLQAQLSTIAVQKFMSGGAGGATPLLGSASTVTDQLQRGELSRVALDQGAGTTDEMVALVADLDAETNTLEARKTEQADLLASLEQQQEQGEALVQQYEQQYAQAQIELGNALAEEQQRRAAEAIAEAQAREAQQQQNHPVVATPSRGGGAAAPATPTTTGGGAGGGAAAPGTTTDPGAGSGGGGGSGGGDSTGGGGGGGGGAVEPTPEPPAPSVPPPSSLAGIAINAAQSQLGVAYKFAAESPGVAFDCSGLTKYAWGKAGVYLPHQSSAQYASTPHVPKDQVQPGDLIFYYAPIGHVGIYIGGGSMIHAPSPGKVVSVAPVYWNKVVGVSRPG